MPRTETVSGRGAVVTCAESCVAQLSHASSDRAGGAKDLVNRSGPVRSSPDLSRMNLRLLLGKLDEFGQLFPARDLVPSLCEYELGSALEQFFSRSNCLRRVLADNDTCDALEVLLDDARISERVEGARKYGTGRIAYELPELVRPCLKSTDSRRDTSASWRSTGTRREAHVTAGNR